MELVGGLLDGQLLDVTGRPAQEVVDGALLMSDHGRSVRAADPGAAVALEFVHPHLRRREVRGRADGFVREPVPLFQDARFAGPEVSGAAVDRPVALPGCEWLPYGKCR